MARPFATRGVAHALIAWCRERARERGSPRLRLDCWDGNATLRAYYRAAGFRELEAVPEHRYAVRLFEMEIPDRT